MPEGPEAKIACDYLNQTFENSIITNVEILTQYYQDKYWEVFNCLKESLVGGKLNAIVIGKNTFIKLKDNSYFNYHLGMTGSWLNEYRKHCHFKILSEKDSLYFFDVRKFGKHKIISNSDFNSSFRPQFDLLNSAYNRFEHLSMLRSRVSGKRNICSVLMDQKLFPGIGNYIKSEILYSSKIHPDCIWGKLSVENINQVLINAQDIMFRSYENGGAELKDFKNPFNKSRFILHVYGKKSDSKNNNVISNVTKDQRKTWWCPSIQIIGK